MYRITVHDTFFKYCNFIYINENVYVCKAVRVCVQTKYVGDDAYGEGKIQ